MIPSRIAMIMLGDHHSRLKEIFLEYITQKHSYQRQMEGKRTLLTF